MGNFKLSDMRFYGDTNERYYAFSDKASRITLRMIYDGLTVKLYGLFASNSYSIHLLKNI